jgi:hypothetical protein
MYEYPRKHVATTPAGTLTLATWLLYIVSIAILYYPTFLASLLTAAFFGLVACAAVVFGFRYWRAAVILSVIVYAVVYVVRVLRMTGMTADQSFLSSVTSYYAILWQVSLGIFQEKGVTGGLAQLFLEYVMPLLAVVLLVLVWASRRRTAGASYS